MDIWILEFAVIIECSENEHKTVSHKHQSARLAPSKATNLNAKDQEQHHVIFYVTSKIIFSDRLKIWRIVNDIFMLNFVARSNKKIVSEPSDPTELQILLLVTGMFQYFSQIPLEQPDFDSTEPQQQPVDGL